MGIHGRAGKRPPEKSGGGKLRRGRNIFTGTPKNTLEYAFDAPPEEGGSALELEAISWSGDSGGPAFIVEDGVRYIAGVNSGGDCCNYGQMDKYARLSSAGSKAWIDASIAADEAQAIDDCATWAAGDVNQGTSSGPSPSRGSSDEDSDEEPLLYTTDKRMYLKSSTSGAIAGIVGIVGIGFCVVVFCICFFVPRCGEERHPRHGGPGRDSVELVDP